MILIPGEQVGSAYATIKLDDGPLNSGMSNARGSFSSFASGLESRASSAGATIGKSLAVGVAALGVALAGVATVGVKSYMDIESAAADAASKMDLSAIAQKSGTTTKAAFDSVKEHVMSLSDQLGQLNTNAFDPTQIAQGLAGLAAGGFDVAKASAADLTDVLALATATNYGLDKSAGLATSTCAQFGLGMEGLSRVSDVYAMAAGKSKAGMSDFDYAMQQAGPVAKGVGMSFEELTARVSKLADAGYGGEKSGTALRTAMMALTSPTKTQADTFAKLGITFDQVNPKQHSFSETLDLLISKGADIYDFGEIYGKEGAAIVYTTAQQSAEVRGLTKELEGSKGAAAEMAKFMLDTLSGSLDTAKGAASSLAYAIGKDLAPTVKAALDWFSSSGAPAIREFYNAFKAGDFSSIFVKIQDGIKGIGVVLGSGLLVAGAASLTATVAGMAARVLASFAAMAAGAIASVATWATGVGAQFAAMSAMALARLGEMYAVVVARFVTMKAAALAHIGEMVTATVAKYSAMATGAIAHLVTMTAMSVGQWAMQSAVAIAATMKMVGGVVAGYAIMAEGAIFNFGIMATESAARWGTMAAQSIAGAAKTAAGALAGIAVMVAGVVTGFVTMSLGAAGHLASMVARTLAGFAVMAAGAVASAVSMAAGVVAAFLGMASTLLAPIALIVAGIAAIGLALTTDWSAAGKSLSGAFETTKKTFQAVWDLVKKGDFTSAASKIGTAFKNAAKWAWEGFKNIRWSDVVAGAVNAVRAGTGIITSTLSGIGQSLYGAFTSINWVSVGSSVMSGLKSAMEYLSGIGKNVYDAITKVDWRSIGQSILTSLQNIPGQIQGLFSGIDFGAMWNSLTSSVSGIASSISTTLSNIRWGDLGYQAGKALSSAIESAITSLSNIGSTIVGYLKTAASSASSIGSDIGSSIKNGLATISGWMDQAKTGFLVGWDDTGKKIGEFIKTGLATITDYAKGIYDNIYNGIKAWVDGDSLSKIGKDAGANFLKAIGAAIYVGAAGISQIASALWTALTQAPKWIAMGVEAIGKFAQGFVQGALDTLVDGMELALLKGVQAALNQIATSTHIPGLDTWAKNSLDPVNTEIEKLQSRLTKLGDTHVDANVDVDTSYVGGSDPSSINGGHYTATMDVATNYLPTSYTGTSGQTLPAPKIGGISGYDQGKVGVSGSGANSELTALYNGVRLTTSEIAQAMKLQGYTNQDIRNLLTSIQADRTAGNIAVGQGAGNPIITDAYFKKLGIAGDSQIANANQINAANAASASSINAQNISTTERAATITTASLVESGKNFFGSAQGAGQLIYGAGSDFFGFSQAAGSSIVSASQAAAATQAQASGYAATALKIGAEIGGKFTTDAGQAVSISMANGGTALIGSIGQGSANHVNAMNQGAAIGINAANQQGSIGTGAASVAANTTTSAATAASGSLVSGAKEAASQFATGVGSATGGLASFLSSFYGSSGATGSSIGGGTIESSSGTNNFNDCFFEGFTDSCTGQLVNPLIYTNPQGDTSYINPMTYASTGGIANYQGAASSGNTSSAMAGYSLPAIFAAKGYLANEGPKAITVGERGTELVLPNDISRTIIDLTASGGVKGRGTQEIHNHIYLNHREIAEQVFRIGAESMQTRGLSIR